MHQGQTKGSAVHPSLKGKIYAEYNSGKVKNKPTKGAFGKTKTRKAKPKLDK
jgi:hypothetical protein